jgi:hypothetical protein
MFTRSRLEATERGEEGQTKYDYEMMTGGGIRGLEARFIIIMSLMKILATRLV